ncbi:hypothetical protein X975_26365, partial [Stegodyphus mimosarum]
MQTIKTNFMYRLNCYLTIIVSVSLIHFPTFTMCACENECSMLHKIYCMLVTI